jgi:hypothetical protein
LSCNIRALLPRSGLRLRRTRFFRRVTGRRSAADVLVLHRNVLATFTPRTFSRCLRSALLANIIPRQNPIIAPRNAAVIMTLNEETLLVSANRKAAYAIHRGHTIRRRRLIAGDYLQVE